MAKRPESAQTGVQAAVLFKETCNELNWVCNRCNRARRGPTWGER